MSLGNNNDNNGKLFVLKVKTTDENKKNLANPVFQVLEKNEENKWVITNTVPSVSGRLSKVDVKESVWEGDTYYTVSALVKDDAAEESYLVDFKMNLMNRSIFNSLLNIDKSKDIKIGLYTSKKGYPAGSVRQGENLIDWKYSLDQVPKADEIEFKGKVMRDYTAVDSFFITKLREFGASLSSVVSEPAAEKPASAPAKKAKVVKNEVKQEVAVADVDSDGDLF